MQLADDAPSGSAFGTSEMVTGVQAILTTVQHHPA